MNYDFDISKIRIACHVKKGDGDLVHRNRQNHGIVYFVEGEKLYTFDTGERISVGATDILYLPKNSNYKVDIITEGDCYAINFNLSSNEVFKEFSVNTKNSSAFKMLFAEATQVWDKNDYGAGSKIKSILYNIIYLLQTEYNYKYISKRTAKLILPAMEYIHNNYTTENISITELARLCSMSDTYFRRIFKSVYGITPIMYINSLKLNRASELISSGMYSIHDAATNSGYFDDSYFCREFKKHFGVMPSKYVDAILSKSE